MVAVPGTSRQHGDPEASDILDLADLLDEHHGDLSLIVAGRAVRLPPTAGGLLRGVISEMARGNTVHLVPTDMSLTSEQVAALLNVPTAFVEQLTEQRELPSKGSGAHSRVGLRDALAYRERQYTRQEAALRELSLEPATHEAED